MRVESSLRVVLATAVVIVTGGAARADYYSHPELRPARRCKDIPQGIGDPADPGGSASLHCQRLLWDLPAPALNTVAVGAQFAEDPIPRFPNGLTDRIPPMFMGTLNQDVPELGKQAGEIEGFEYEADCTANASGCQRLCTDPLDIPYWQELLNPDGSSQIGSDGSGHEGVNEETGASTGQEQTGPLFKVQCTHGTRAYYGPWQTGGAVDPIACKDEPGSDTDAVAGVCQGPVFDRLTPAQPVRLENTDRLDADFGTGDDVQRLEWNVGSEFYNDFASHHAVCNQPTDACASVNDPPPRSAFDENDPSAQCYNYEKASAPGSSCYAEDADPRACSGNDRIPMGGFRNATQLPGRLSVPLPGGRAVLGTEDVIWGCNHHVVTQLPPGSYGMTRLANYRLQTHGLTNETSDTIWGVSPKGEYGGSVGEMIIQYFAKPLATPNLKPVNVMFNAVADAATTYYPPFTWNYHQSDWEPPFDAEIGLMAIHSHHRMVKGTMNVAPVNPPRPNETDPICGGPKADGSPATDLYTDWYWEDAPVCHYWKQKDGPVPLRKGESIHTTCYVNNGITPEAIKHGLVGGASVEALKALGAPIPDYPELVPASTWGDALASSAVGKELLYGTHPPINYRVVYKCSTVPVASRVPGSTLAVVPTGFLYKICPPNPEVDADGDYLDGPYVNELQCGTGGLCQPGSIVFACIGEDEMCIGVAMYWAMERILNPDGSPNEQAMQNLQDGNLNEVGTPGSTGVATDVLQGNCPECQPGL